MTSRGRPGVLLEERGDRILSSVVDHGIGLTLTLVQRIVGYHGGKIWIESKGAGQGSTLLFTLLRGEDTVSGPTHQQCWSETGADHALFL